MDKKISQFRLRVLRYPDTTLDVPQDTLEKIMSRLEQLAGLTHDQVERLMSGGISFTWPDGDWKWPIQATSREFPTLLFKLFSDNVDLLSSWVGYFMAGRVHRDHIEVQYPPFDPKRLRG